MWYQPTKQTADTDLTYGEEITPMLMHEAYHNSFRCAEFQILHG